MSEKQILAIVPARGGSKGIPGKNIIPLAGKPLLAHTLEQAHNSSVITRLTVSTDDQAIAQVAEQHGAEVIWRPADISSDTASSESALIHVLRSPERLGRLCARIDRFPTMHFASTPTE